MHACPGREVAPCAAPFDPLSASTDMATTQHSHTPSNLSARRGITIVGAGIIGISCAVALQRAGVDVTVVDSREPGEGCSKGNAGILAAYSVVPLSTPGILRKTPSMLFDPLGPLTMRWAHLPQMVPWLYRFWRASMPPRVEAAASLLATLLRTSVADHLAAVAGTGAERWVRASPLLCVYPDEAAFERDAYVWRLRQAHGIRFEILRGDALHVFEPALSTAYRFALLLDGCGFSTDPQQLVKALAAHVVRQGGRIVQREVRDIEIGPNGPTDLMTDAGRLPIDKLLLCAGAWSGHFARRLGSPVPLQSQRGYHITLAPQNGATPHLPVMSPSQKVIATPMACGLRLAGQVEFGGLIAKPDYRRAQRLTHHLTQLFPSVDTTRLTEWMGHRPTLPDSLPVIGQSPHFSNVFYAFGHHHVGLTAAPMTARLIAQLATGQPTEIDLAPFRIDRF